MGYIGLSSVCFLSDLSSISELILVCFYHVCNYNCYYYYYFCHWLVLWGERYHFVLIWVCCTLVSLEENGNLCVHQMPVKSGILLEWKIVGIMKWSLFFFQWSLCSVHSTKNDDPWGRWLFCLLIYWIPSGQWRCLVLAECIHDWSMTIRRKRGRKEERKERRQEHKVMWKNRSLLRTYIYLMSFKY